MKRLVIIAFSVLMVTLAHAQASKEGDIWYFGNNAGLNFNTGAPVALTNGQMNNLEGVASIANKNGHILFYSDGMEVYNKYHQLLNPGNDLGGHNSSTQSGVIVPQPVRGNRFYLFTVDEEGGALEYAILDSNGSGGTGSIFSRNHRLLNASTEKITAVLHANKTDIWIIAHEWGNNKFYAWLLTGTGLSSTPKISTIGPSHSGNTGYSKGYMKSSPDGSKLALAVVGSQAGFGSTNDGRWELYDFDNNTGLLSNAMSFTNANKPTAVNEYDGAYGVEFSPNGRFLYISCWNVRGSNDRLFQFDLRAGNRSFADINNSAYQVASSSGTNDFGALQLAPDGRIYIARGNRGSLSYIEYPNCPTSSCNYTANGPSLSGASSRYGLPTFIQTFFNEPEFDFGDSTGSGTGICLGDSTQFWLFSYADLDSVQWFFGDPSSGTTNNYSTDINPKHVFSSSGTFTVKAIIYRSATALTCDLDTVERDVTIIPLPSVNLGRDTMLCQGQTISRSMQDFSKPNATYRWSTGGTGPSLQMSSSNTYWGEMTSEGCSNSDTIVVTVIQYPDLNLPSDTFICLPDSVFLYPGEADTYLWSTSSTDSAVYGKTAGSISVIATNSNLCTSYDTVVVQSIANLGLSLSDFERICTGDSLTINAYKGIDGYSYLWSTGETDSAITVNSNGLYTVEVYDSLCHYFDSLVLDVQIPTGIYLGADTVLCAGETHELDASVPGATYIWHDNSIDSVFLVSTAGLKYVDITEDQCEYSDSIQVDYITLPQPDLGADTTICAGQEIKFVFAPSSEHKITWNELVVSDSITITTSGEYRVWVSSETPANHCNTYDTIYVTVQPTPVFSLGNDTTLCQGDSLILDISSFPNLTTFKWFDLNPNAQRRNKSNVTSHWVELSDGICTIIESIDIDYHPTINISAGPDIKLCDNETQTVSISSTNATSFSWRNLSGNQISANRDYIVSSAGTYVAVASINQCSTTDTMEAQYFVTPIFNLGADTTYCNDFSRTLIINASADDYLWSDGSKLTDFTTSTPALIWAQASNDICVHRDSILIEQMTTPVLDPLIDDQELCELEEFKLSYTREPFTTYEWENGTSVNPRTVIQVGNYWLRATNNCGTDSLGFSIAYKVAGCRVDIPNAFSPNGDNKNDIFRLTGEALLFDQLQVYNRWGELVFEGDPLIGWDGTYKGAEVPTGYYVYTVAYKRTEGAIERWHYQKGVLYLVR